MTLLHRLYQAYRLYRAALKDPRTSAMAKYLPLLSVAYLIWPADILPDVFPLLGQLDDIGVIIALCTWALSLIPESVKRDFERGSKSTSVPNVIDVEPKRP